MPAFPFTVERHEGFSILRDDMLAGGTKRRGLNIMLRGIAANDIFYAGTVMGHGALALAHACADQGKMPHIFICGDNDHPIIEKLRIAGAKIYLQPPMPVSDLHALAAEHANGATVLPPGFDMPEFQTALITALKNFDASPYSEIWAVSVTGALSRALKAAFPDKKVKTVPVVKSCNGDFPAPEKYHQAAKAPPPYPACPHTDAKLWQFVTAHAKEGALVWNVAG